MSSWMHITGTDCYCLRTLLNRFLDSTELRCLNCSLPKTALFSCFYLIADDGFHHYIDVLYIFGILLLFKLKSYHSSYHLSLWMNCNIIFLFYNIQRHSFLSFIASRSFCLAHCLQNLEGYINTPPTESIKTHFF